MKNNKEKIYDFGYFGKWSEKTILSQMKFSTYTGPYIPIIRQNYMGELKPNINEIHDEYIDKKMKNLTVRDFFDCFSRYTTAKDNNKKISDDYNNYLLIIEKISKKTNKKGDKN